MIQQNFSFFSYCFFHYLNLAVPKHTFGKPLAHVIFASNDLPLECCTPILLVIKKMLYGDSCLATLGDPVLSGGNAERARNAANSLHRQLSKVQNYRRQLVPSLVMQNSGNSNEITKKTVEKSREKTVHRMFLKNHSC